MAVLLFYDFEIFKHDWLVVIINAKTKEEHIFVNDSQAFIEFYNEHKRDIWVGYNSRHYDQYIAKGIICEFSLQEINEWIIVQKKPGWQFYKDFWKIPFYNYDVMTKKDKSLKQLEGFMGHNIKESDVSFDTDRKLTNDEIQEVIKYCRHDVQETIHIFTEDIEEFQSHIELIKMFNLPLRHISKTKAQLSAQILEARQPNVPRDDEFDISFPPTMAIQKYTEVVDFYEKNKKL